MSRRPEGLAVDATWEAGRPLIRLAYLSVLFRQSEDYRKYGGAI